MITTKKFMVGYSCPKQLKKTVSNRIADRNGFLFIFFAILAKLYSLKGTQLEQHIFLRGNSKISKTF